VKKRGTDEKAVAKEDSDEKKWADRKVRVTLEKAEEGEIS